MRNLILLLILSLATSNVMAQVKVADTNGSQYYRIPVILKDNDGNLVALYDDRHN